TQTWSVDLADGGWTQVRAPQAVPGPRRGHSLTTLPGSADVVLFGGLLGGQPLGDAWRFDGERRTQLSGTLPPARAHHAAAAEALLDAAVISGGEGGAGPFGDTWVFGSDGGVFVFGPGMAPRARPIMTHAPNIDT